MKAKSLFLLAVPCQGCLLLLQGPLELKNLVVEVVIPEPEVPNLVLEVLYPLLVLVRTELAESCGRSNMAFLRAAFCSILRKLSLASNKMLR